MVNRGFAAAVIVLAVSMAARAQTPRRGAGNDPDVAEVSNYRLTVPVLEKVKVATKAYADAVQNDPKFLEFTAARKELTALKEKDAPTPQDEQRIQALEAKIDAMEQAAQAADEGETKTLADLERKIAKMPHLAEALQSAGLSAREFARFELAGLQAAMVAEYQKTGQLKEIPPGVSKENVQFILDHEKELADINEMMRGLGK
jgi:hypothetical protein